MWCLLSGSDTRHLFRYEIENPKPNELWEGGRNWKETKQVFSPCIELNHAWELGIQAVCSTFDSQSDLQLLLGHSGTMLGCAGRNQGSKRLFHGNLTVWGWIPGHTLNSFTVDRLWEASHFQPEGKEHDLAERTGRGAMFVQSACQPGSLRE